MQRMVRVLVGLLIVGLAVVVATAQGATLQKVDGTVKLAQLSHTGTPPINGTTANAGTYSGAVGPGAIKGSIAYSAPSFTGKLRVYNLRGTTLSTTTGTGTANPDGSISFTGTGKVISGTGRYRGAKGTFTFSGTQPKDSNVSTFTIKGSFKY